MFVKSYKITEPKRFEIFIEDLNCDGILVRPEYLAVCKADIRYYLGNRDVNVLKKKFPMSLIHEATGVVIRDKSGEFEPGQRVVMLPCLKADCDNTKCIKCVRNDDKLLDNYCPESRFRSSNFDGFSKEIINTESEYLIKIPDGIGAEAVFSELISVGCCAMRRAGLWEKKEKKIAVWGDGIMGYIISLVAKYGIGADVSVVGLSPEKLAKFDFADTYFVNNIESMPNVSVAIEAVGGNAAASAVNQAIDKLCSGGKIILSGVSNDNAPINTRMVLEHGLTLMGTTRSVRCDFEKAVGLLTLPEFRERILRLVEGIDVIDNVNGYYRAFDDAAKSQALGKRIMKMVF
ncbi:MAG: alcohol dehydrogenase catalytic domain-containing protein [Clostridia bacterium]|nr:alcohol dehydrogenase catalytic domain-containing protein [Clostridia bacterium]